MSYLGRLALRMAAGAVRLPPELRDRHAAYLGQRQQADGGFAGRAGPSDPYYTGFGLRGLAMLGALDARRAAAAAEFVAARAEAELPPIDMLSSLQSAVLLDTLGGGRLAETPSLRARLDSLLGRLRRPDGGYAKTPTSGPSSTYGSFLVAATLTALGQAVPAAGALAALAVARQRADGGFVELPVMRTSGSNPTAAALGILAMCNGDAEAARRGRHYLATLQGDAGGWFANAAAPVADLLSTFTALAALVDSAEFAEVNHAAAARFAHSCEVASGGFLAGTWDDEPDVEYTFYGLGTLAILAAER